MQSHYAITSEVRYYKANGETHVDFSRWKDPPHVALANLRDEPEAVLRFTRTYGDMPSLAPERRGRKVASIEEVLNYRDSLRRAWEGDTGNFFRLACVETILITQPKPTGMLLAVRDPWSLICIMFAQDWPERLLRKCTNPDCSAPYFRAVRKGQKFCSQKCAVLINVRQFRAREADLKAKGGKHAKAKKA